MSEGYLKSHFGLLPEIMAEECDITCSGHVIHLTCLKKIIFTGGMRKTTATESCVQEAGSTSCSCCSRGEAPYPKSSVGAGHHGSAGVSEPGLKHKTCSGHIPKDLAGANQQGSQGMPMMANSSFNTLISGALHLKSGKW